MYLYSIVYCMQQGPQIPNFLTHLEEHLRNPKTSLIQT